MLSKAQIKTIHSLRHKKYRQKSGRFLAEGVKVVDELLKGGHIKVHNVFALDSWLTKRQSLEETDADLILTPVTEQELKQISSLDTPQQVVALCELPPMELQTNLQGKVTIMLESVRDPGNLGTIIRIADWFGIESIICSPDCVDAFNPKTVQATMGSIARVRVLEMPLEDMIAKHKTVPVYATTLQGQSITGFHKITEGILWIGNESKGLSEKVLQKATYCITIPRLGCTESLNAAIATGIICSRLLL